MVIKKTPVDIYKKKSKGILGLLFHSERSYSDKIPTAPTEIGTGSYIILPFVVCATQ